MTDGTMNVASSDEADIQNIFLIFRCALNTLSSCYVLELNQTYSLNVALIILTIVLFFIS